jgi:hypothetical protein
MDCHAVEAEITPLLLYHLKFTCVKVLYNELPQVLTTYLFMLSAESFRVIALQMQKNVGHTKA